MSAQGYCTFLESEQFPVVKLLSLGVWGNVDTSCLFYFMASLEDTKLVFIPEFNKNKIILATIELLLCLLLNHVKWVQLAEALPGFSGILYPAWRWLMLCCLPNLSPHHQPTDQVRKHVLRPFAQKHIYKNVKTFWLPRIRNLDRNPFNGTCSRQLP